MDRVQATEGGARTVVTGELRRGMRLLIGGRLVRTVASVRESGYLNYRNDPIYTVSYAEGDTPEWSGGNTGAPNTEWTLAR